MTIEITGYVGPGFSLKLTANSAEEAARYILDNYSRAEYWEANPVTAQPGIRDCIEKLRWLA